MVCSMWQIIRHANQAEAAVESLIMVRVPHKGTSPPPRAPPDSGSPPPPSHPPPFSPAALVPPDRQMDQRQRLNQWEERRVWGRLGGMVGCGTGGGVAMCGFGRGGTVYFWIPLKCQSEYHCCFSSAQNK